MAVEVRRTAAGLQLDLTGEWGMREVEADRAQLAAIDLGGVRELKVSTRGVDSLELSGAWALREFLQRARAAGVAVSFEGRPPDQLRRLPPRHPSSTDCCTTSAVMSCAPGAMRSHRTRSSAAPASPSSRGLGA